MTGDDMTVGSVGGFKSANSDYKIKKEENSILAGQFGTMTLAYMSLPNLLNGSQGGSQSGTTSGYQA